MTAASTPPSGDWHRSRRVRPSGRCQRWSAGPASSPADRTNAGTPPPLVCRAHAPAGSRPQRLPVAEPATDGRRPGHPHAASMVVVVSVGRRLQWPRVNNDQRRPNSARRISSDRAARSPLPECSMPKNSGWETGSDSSASWLSRRASASAALSSMRSSTRWCSRSLAVMPSSVRSNRSREPVTAMMTATAASAPWHGQPAAARHALRTPGDLAPARPENRRSCDGATLPTPWPTYHRRAPRDAPEQRSTPGGRITPRGL